MEKRPTLDPTLVQNFVANAHSNLDRVIELLKQEPTLINATWDWGGGDWETALGAASHMGRKDIALYLLEKGARMDIFAAAMLGQVHIVQSILKAFPNARNSLGPHGIPLLAHAKAGGQDALPVLKLLQNEPD
jgi:hypothetical protein